MNEAESVSVTVIIPTFQEENCIAGCLDSILRNDFDFAGTGSEILVIDGGSTDETCDIVRDYESRFLFVRLLHNPRQFQASALNIGARIAKGDIIFRCDAHGVYPRDYVTELLRCHASIDAGNVGGTCDPRPGSDGLVARAIALTMRSRLGYGPSEMFSRSRSLQPVSAGSVWCGSWKREMFVEIGLLDEELHRGEDLDLNIRIRRAGKRVLLLPWVRTQYYSRDTLPKLWRMAYQCGFWKIRVNRKHGLLSTKRQLIPPTAAVADGLLFLVAPFSALAFSAWLFGNGLYLLIVLAAASREAWRVRDPFVIAPMIAAFAALHFGYAVGYLTALCEPLVPLSRSGLQKISEVTR